MEHRRFTRAALVVLLGLLLLTQGVFLPAQPVFAEAESPESPDAGRRIFFPNISQGGAITTLSGGRNHYVSPSGSSNGDGSSGRPWDLETALSQPDNLRPGDTVWLRAGTYVGNFVATLRGLGDAYITVRPVIGERVVLDSRNADKVLIIRESAYVNFWGLEITNSRVNRYTSAERNGNDGVLIDQNDPSHHINLINLVVHDVGGQGIAFWETAIDSSIYGSVIYYNGVNQFDHGIYTQNDSGTKRIADNYIFFNASHGIHAYGSSDSNLNNIQIQSNIAFENGAIGYNSGKGRYDVAARNILMGGGTVAQNPVVEGNIGYYADGDGTNLNVGYDGGAANPRIVDNFLMGGKVIFKVNNPVIDGNIINAASVEGITTSRYPGNSWLSDSPGGVQIFVRPNAYEPNRANLVIFNWEKHNTVGVPASELASIGLKAGDKYALYNVQDLYVDVVNGVFDGKTLNVPMTGHSVAQPKDLDFKPDSTFPLFGTFIIVNYGQ